mmetsp:Transcript_36917/g.95604  ORF Transcript_36917/g.95604 Transcript_36917/m.95604 type:complete len:94 (+) Transcript_36917:399-680(+)
MPSTSIKPGVRALIEERLREAGSLKNTQPCEGPRQFVFVFAFAMAGMFFLLLHPVSIQLGVSTQTLVGWSMIPSLVVVFGFFVWFCSSMFQRN